MSLEVSLFLLFSKEEPILLNIEDLVQLLVQGMLWLIILGVGNLEVKVIGSLWLLEVMESMECRKV